MFSICRSTVRLEMLSRLAICRHVNPSARSCTTARCLAVSFIPDCLCIRRTSLRSTPQAIGATQTRPQYDCRRLFERSRPVAIRTSGHRPVVAGARDSYLRRRCQKADGRSNSRRRLWISLHHPRDGDDGVGGFLLVRRDARQPSKAGPPHSEYAMLDVCRIGDVVARRVRVWQ
jgi:hypothetical protein